MTAPRVQADLAVLRVLAVLAGVSGPVRSRALATSIGANEKSTRVAVKSCIDSGWAVRVGQTIEATPKGMRRATARDVQAAVADVVAPRRATKGGAAASAGATEPYAVRRAAELLAGGFTAEEVSGILRLPVGQVREIRPCMAPQRTGALVTDAKALRGRHGSAPSRDEDYTRRGGGGPVLCAGVRL